VETDTLIVMAVGNFLSRLQCADANEISLTTEESCTYIKLLITYFLATRGLRNWVGFITYLGKWN